MGDAIILLIIVGLLLIAVCIIVVLVLTKDAKELHIHFEPLKGFDISCSFFRSNSRRKSLSSVEK